MSGDRKPDLSVIIASIGRQSIIEVIDQIFKDAEQTNFEVEVCIFFDNKNISALIIDKIEEFSNVKYQVSESKLNFGPAYAFNQALEMATASSFCFFSDDDIWLCGRVETICSLLFQTQHTLLQSRSIYFDGFKTTLRPKRALNTQTLIFNQIFNFQNPFRNNRRYTSLICFAATSDLLHVKFRQNLRILEDVFWLADVQKNTPKLSIIWTSEVTSKIEVDLDRAKGRLTNESLENLRDAFLDYSPRYHSHYIWQVLGRPFAILGDLHSLSTISSLNVKKSRFDLFIFNFLRLIGTIKWVKNRFFPIKH
jgi:glycosyltransferase involved in cell wall biosynthesis